MQDLIKQFAASNELIYFGSEVDADGESTHACKPTMDSPYAISFLQKGGEWFCALSVRRGLAEQTKYGADDHMIACLRQIEDAERFDAEVVGVLRAAYLLSEGIKASAKLGAPPPRDEGTSSVAILRAAPFCVDLVQRMIATRHKPKTEHERARPRGASEARKILDKVEEGRKSEDGSTE